MTVTKTRNNMTKKSLYACRNTPNQRWGQAIVNNFKLKDDKSYSSYADRLWNADDTKTQKIVETMIKDFNLP